MKHVLSIMALFFLFSCTSQINTDKALNIDIYQSDMTYEKFKQYVIEYADKSTYPNLTNEK
tara:strand:- start:78 stop:260 length:183 start_codon:yes stop_codon:yes gene_type:complete